MSDLPRNSVRCAVDVVAGVIPGTPEPKLSRQYFLYSEEWHAALGKPEEQADLLTELAGKANAYATYLMLQPERVNWVKTEWVWM